MDLEKLAAQIEKLQDDLKDANPTSEEYRIKKELLKEYQEMYLKERRAEDERMDRDRRYELDKDKLDADIAKNENEVKQAKKNNFWGFIGKILGAVTSIFLVFCLDEVKRESIIDKDAFSVARGWFPRG